MAPSAPLNIAMFASAFYPSLGGVEEVCRQLALELRRQGHQVIILTNRWPRNLPARQWHQGLEIFRLPFRVPQECFKSKLSYFLTHRAIVRSMLHILRRRRIDVLHVQCVSSNGYYAMIAKRRLGLPLIVTAHGELTMDASGLYQRSAFQNAVLRDLADNAERLTACSRRTLQDVEKHLGTDLGPRRAIIYNGAPLEEFASPRPHVHRRPYVLCMGRLVPQKGFELMLDAFADAGDMGVDLLIAGEGPLRQALQERIACLGLGERAFLLGRADRGFVAALFAGAEFFVLPSIADEGLPLVCVEAMAASKPVVAAAVGGVGEYVLHEETGLLFARGDRQQLTAALRRLAGDHELRLRLGAAGRTRAQTFGWPAIARQCVELYRTAIDRPRIAS
jgi:glycosyltransferase involved in cell wall biosynthesis